MKTENTVAMKVTSLSELVNIRNELALQKTCHHSNIVFVGDCFNWRDKLWIVMEFMEKGSPDGHSRPRRALRGAVSSRTCVRASFGRWTVWHRDNRSIAVMITETPNEKTSRATTSSSMARAR